MEILKKAFVKLINFGENVEGALKDKRINFLEAATLAGGLGAFVFFVIQNYEALRAELKDLTDEQKEELKSYLKDELDLENDKVEGIIEESFDLIQAIIAFVQKLKK